MRAHINTTVERFNKRCLRKQEERVSLTFLGWHFDSKRMWCSEVTGRYSVCVVTRACSRQMAFSQ